MQTTVSLTIQGTILNYDEFLKLIVGIGIIIDADYDKNIGKIKFNKIKNQLKGFVKLPQNPGEIISGKVNSGFFILPDNKTDGTLEGILINCAKANYMELYEGALSYVEKVNIKSLQKTDKEDFIKPTGKNKAIVACIGNIMRPGKAIQVSIQDNRWVDENTIGLPEIKLINEFLQNLFKLN